MAVEDAGEEGTGDGNGRFKREAEGEREDVAGAGEGGFAAESRGGEAIVRV